MREQQERFLLHLLRTGSLIFQPTKVKSGRIPPYYVSIRRAIDSGQKAIETAKAYADEIIKTVGLDFDYLHGPAYAGIPLVALTAAVLWEHHGIEKRWGYDRKEEKAYGEKGQELIVGDIRDGDQVLIQDDVITTGKTKVDNWQNIKSVREHLKPRGIVIAVDREELDESGKAATITMEEAGLKVYSILKITQVIDWLRDREIDGKIYVTESVYKVFREYFTLYGTYQLN